MALVTQHEIGGREAYKHYAQINVTPTSRGTWTVSAHFRTATNRTGKSKRFTGLADHFEVVQAVVRAQDWLDEQSSGNGGS